MKIALAVILAVLFLLSIMTDRVLRSLPAKELRRRARSQKDKKSATLYKLAAYGRSAEFFLWLMASLSLAGLVLVVATTSWWIVLLVILVTKWLLWQNRTPKSYEDGRLSLAALVALLSAPLVSFLQPILSRITGGSKKYGPLYQPTRLYEKEDLLEFLKIQARQQSNRISSDELEITRSALDLSEKTVSDVMLARRKVKWVAANESIGPMVMDELHKSGQSRFPVVKEVTKATSPEIVGSLYIRDLLDHLEDKGRIRDIMHSGTRYINESQNLVEAIDGFLKSGQLLLVVVNNFEEVVGILTLEDVLKQIFGDKISGDFDRYHDIRSVAGANNGQAAEAEVE